MNIKGQIKLFTEGKKSSEGYEFLAFSTSVSHKNEDGTYLNTSMEVKFVGDMFDKGQRLAPDMVYTINVEEGWLDLRTYADKDKKVHKVIYLAISKAKTEGKPKKIVKAKAEDLNENNMPF